MNNKFNKLPKLVLYYQCHNGNTNHCLLMKGLHIHYRVRNTTDLMINRAWQEWTPPSQVGPMSPVWQLYVSSVMWDLLDIDTDHHSHSNSSNSNIQQHKYDIITLLPQPLPQPHCLPRSNQEGLCAGWVNVWKLQS